MRFESSWVAPTLITVLAVVTACGATSENKRSRANPSGPTGEGKGGEVTSIEDGKSAAPPRTEVPAELAKSSDAGAGTENQAVNPATGAASGAGPNEMRGEGSDASGPSEGTFCVVDGSNVACECGPDHQSYPNRLTCRASSPYCYVSADGSYCAVPFTDPCSVGYQFVPDDEECAEDAGCIDFDDGVRCRPTP